MWLTEFRKDDNDTRWSKVGSSPYSYRTKAASMTKRSEEDEINALKTENRRLKREVARLTKYLERSPHAQDSFDTHLKPKGNTECPKCKSNDVGEVKIGTKKLVVCRECNWRKMI